MDSKTAILWIQAGGVYHILLALFHLMFWGLFRWREQLERLHPVNRAIMQVLNIRLTYLFVVFALISLFFPADLLETNLGRVLTLALAVFWLMRAFEQPLFFIKNLFTWLFFLVFLLGAVLYAWPLFQTFEFTVAS